MCVLIMHRLVLNMCATVCLCACKIRGSEILTNIYTKKHLEEELVQMER